MLILAKNPRIFKFEKMCSWKTTTCPQGWNHIHNNCFFQFELEKTWIDGQANCMAYHGSLVRFGSQNEVVRFLFYSINLILFIGLMYDRYTLRVRYITQQNNFFLYVVYIPKEEMGNEKS